MTQMLMFVQGVGGLRVALQKSAFPRRSGAGECGSAWHQSHKFPALTNANSIGGKCVFHCGNPGGFMWFLMSGWCRQLHELISPLISTTFHTSTCKMTSSSCSTSRTKMTTPAVLADQYPSSTRCSTCFVLAAGFDHRRSLFVAALQ